MDTSAARTITTEDDPLERENEMLAYVEEHATKGDAKSVVDAIDAFCWDHRFMMHAGDKKGEIIDGVVADASVVVELGMYVGYSATRMAAAAPPTTPIVSVEPHEGRAAIAQKVFEVAGVAERVTWLKGTAADVFPSLSARLKDLLGVESLAEIPKIVFFFDHVKDAYVHDLQLGEELGLFPKGTVVVADNVIYPGAPDFLDYVRSSEEWECSHHPGFLEYSTEIVDGIEVCVRKSE